MLAAVDRGDFGAMLLLDLTAAFDTVDHDILLHRLETTFGFTGNVLQWFRSYLTGRSQCVRLGGEQSSIMDMCCGVPQGSVLGPLLFILYTADLGWLIDSASLRSHQYADDTQIYGSCRPGATNTDALAADLERCAASVFNWLRSNRLSPNPSKSEVIWFASVRRQHQLPATALRLGDAFVLPVRSVRNLGVYLDGALSMQEHVARTVSRCFGALRQLRSIRNSITRPVLQSLAVALVLSRLDYCNSTLAGITSALLRRLQAVQNAAARLIFQLSHHSHISSALIELHWLRVPERINYKLATMTFRALHGVGPRYMDHFRRVADLAGRRSLRSACTGQLVVPPWKLVSAGRRSFPVAGAVCWNQLPSDITSSPTLDAFRSRLKTFLFRQSFPDIS